MRFMVMVRATRSSEAGELPDPAMFEAMGRFNEELVAAGVILAGDGIHPSSAGVRVRFDGTGREVIPGPFPAQELVAGFWLWRCASLEEAIAWARRCPNPMPEASEIEIRPLFEMDDFGEAMTPELREQEAALRARVEGSGG